MTNEGACRSQKLQKVYVCGTESRHTSKKNPPGPGRFGDGKTDVVSRKFPEQPNGQREFVAPSHFEHSTFALFAKKRKVPQSQQSLLTVQPRFVLIDLVLIGSGSIGQWSMNSSPAGKIAARTCTKAENAEQKLKALDDGQDNFASLTANGQHEMGHDSSRELTSIVERAHRQFGPNRGERRNDNGNNKTRGGAELDEGGSDRTVRRL